MPEYTGVELQTVQSNQNILFPNTPVPCSRGYVIHRDGSGVITLRGITNQCRARYKVSFGGNIAVPTGGTAEAISVAISLSGEALPGTIRTVTPAAVNEFFAVSAETFVDVPRGCCVQISVRNVSSQAIDVQNTNILVERVA